MTDASPASTTVATASHRFRLEGDPGAFAAALSSREIAPGLHEVTLELVAGAPAVPPPLKLVWMHPVIDIIGRWHPEAQRDRRLAPDWLGGLPSQMTRSAPVVCFHDVHGRNRLTFACSESFEPITLRAGVFEETAELRCMVELFQPPRACAPRARYACRVRVDTRDLRYSAALDEVRRWWESHSDSPPLDVPDTARRPFYSTWYSFHQILDADEIVAQCRLARDLGCEAVIVDDGWQTLDSGRGYAYCGDWRPERLPDMRGLVRRVRELDMRFLLWYAVPFVGRHSEAFRRFADRQLTYIDDPRTGVLDPRYPEVRAYLIDTFERALRDWELDGFKFDFLEWFDAAKAPPPSPDMDHADVPEAALRLLGDILAALRAIRPEVMIEFRQPYIGPVMRRYANMFRSGDCPDDAVTNRLNTLDLRLLCGPTVVHGDMFMWHADEPVERAALQVLAILFSVPQVSVRIEQLPPDHREMLRFWLGFWREYRDVLLDGTLHPISPELLYPAVLAETDRRQLIAWYADVVARPHAPVPQESLLVNATGRDRVVLELDRAAGPRQARTVDCRGRMVSEEPINLTRGLHRLAIPPAGLMTLRAV